MDHLNEVVALLRQQAELEILIMNSAHPEVTAERALATTRRRLVSYPEALTAVLQTAHALPRSPDTVSVRKVRALVILGASTLRSGSVRDTGRAEPVRGNARRIFLPSPRMARAQCHR